MSPSGSVVSVVRWTARIWGTTVALFWGVFLLEHLVEWFNPSTGLPPLQVWLLQGLHFLMVAALLAAWRYELIGGLLALAASIPFFVAVAGPQVWMFFLITTPPAIAFIWCGVLSSWPRRVMGSPG